MKLSGGQWIELEVARKSPYGFFLTDGYQDVLLHSTEADNELEAGDRVQVFLYHDAEDRLAATMRKPYITLGQTNRLEVADIHPKLGAFLEIGIGRQLLLPASDLPEEKSLWPQVGDVVYVTLSNDKQGRMLARLAGEEELIPLSYPASAEWKNRFENAYVYHILELGVFLITDVMHIGLLHRSEMTSSLRLGQAIRPRITFVREDGRVNFSMRPLKEVGRVEDSERILRFLHECGGQMPYSDATDASVIQEQFGLSKGAFKRALGKLMKDGLIEQKEGKSFLKQPTEADLKD